MTAFLVANLAPLMFGALVVFLLLGYPVAFSLAANGLFFGIVAIDLGLLQPQLLQALPERVFGIMRNDTLLAIPFFTFMGLILERSGMAEDLLETIGQMFGPVRGPWAGDWRGWWGDEPPYHAPVFVLTHHEREPVEMAGGTTFYFVNDGIETVLQKARQAASDKDVAISGGDFTDGEPDPVIAGRLDALVAELCAFPVPRAAA